MMIFTRHTGKVWLIFPLSVSCFLFPSLATATNGMLMEGYGPESTAMGGAAAAFDNGAGGMANNPATLVLMEDGSSRLDVTVGNLRPDVNTTSTFSPSQPSADSNGDSYLMPAVGWVKRSGAYSYGLGIYSQGGMGTEYDRDTFKYYFTDGIYQLNLAPPEFWYSLYSATPHTNRPSILLTHFVINFILPGN